MDVDVSRCRVVACSIAVMQWKNKGWRALGGLRGSARLGVHEQRLLLHGWSCGIPTLLCRPETRVTRQNQQPVRTVEPLYVEPGAAGGSRAAVSAKRPNLFYDMGPEIFDRTSRYFEMKSQRH